MDECVGVIDVGYIISSLDIKGWYIVVLATVDGYGVNDVCFNGEMGVGDFDVDGDVGLNGDVDLGGDVDLNGDLACIG